MADDWIRMRTDLYRDPKVCAMAGFMHCFDSGLGKYVFQNLQGDMTVTRNVIRNAVVGALVTVWGVTRKRGRREGTDLVVRAMEFGTIDDIADMPGFGDAMAHVGWAVETEDSVVFPRFFEEYNSDPNDDLRAKNAERQRRFRGKNRSVTITLPVTSQSNIDKTIVESDKRRMTDLAGAEKSNGILPDHTDPPKTNTRLIRALSALGEVPIAKMNRGTAARMLQTLPDPLAFITRVRKQARAQGFVGDHEAKYVFKSIKSEAEGE